MNIANTARLPRGIRNNNPGNIEASPSNPWQGAEGDDGRFVKFKDAKWGIRAMAVLLTNYQLVHKLETLEQIINRWAPPVENQTGRYVDAVAAAVGVAADAPLDLNKAATMLATIKAMVTIENGQQPYPDSLLCSALQLAGIEAAEEKAVKPLGRSRTVHGVAIAGVGQLLEVLQSNPDMVALVAGLFGPAVGFAVPQLITVAGLAYAAYARYDDFKKGVK